jgi:hypothetical protein
MNESENIETRMTQAMHTRWDSRQPAPNLESTIQTKLSAKRSRKRAIQIVRAVSLSAAALAVIILIFTFPSQSSQWLNNLPPPPNPPSYNSNLFTSFECPTAVPPPLTRYPQPTAAPPTANPYATPQPTRVKKTRAPRPTAAPTPTLQILTINDKWQVYQDPKYGYSLEYPKGWFKLTSYQIQGPAMRVSPIGTFINIWNYSQRNLPAVMPLTAISLSVSLSPALCENENLEQALVENQALASVSPLIPHDPVGGYPAWQHTIESTAGNSTRWLEVVVPRGKWLYRFRATPADSTQLSAFEHLLHTFTTP